MSEKVVTYEEYVRIHNSYIEEYIEKVNFRNKFYLSSSGGIFLALITCFSKDREAIFKDYYTLFYYIGTGALFVALLTFLSVLFSIKANIQYQENNTACYLEFAQIESNKKNRNIYNEKLQKNIYMNFMKIIDFILEIFLITIILYFILFVTYKGLIIFFNFKMGSSLLSFFKLLILGFILLFILIKLFFKYKKTNSKLKNKNLKSTKKIITEDLTDEEINYVQVFIDFLKNKNINKED